MTRAEINIIRALLDDANSVIKTIEANKTGSRTQFGNKRYYQGIKSTCERILKRERISKNRRI